MNLNEAKLIGRLTRDPEIKMLPSGSKACNFSVATNHTYKDKDGKKVETTTFHNCKMFGKGAEVFAQYAKKGQEVYVCGRIEHREWEKDGVKRQATEILVDDFQFGAKAGAGGGSRGGGDTSSTYDENNGLGSNFGEPEASGGSTEDINPDDIPF